MNYRRIILSSLALAVASAAHAQQPASAVPDDPVKPQVQTFEMVLRGAVDKGGQNFAKRASQVVPVIISPGDTPVASGVAVRDLGVYVFEVQVPGIWQTSVVLNMMMNRAQPAGTRSVADSRVSATAGTVNDDPATAASVSTFEPDREYTADVREALISAVLDSSGVLPITASESLVIIVGGAEPAAPNAFYRTTLRKLVLSVKGADLVDFRQGRLSRDELRARIKQNHF